jgi:hypothetical protein
MLDKDLVELYGVSTKRLNEQVKRNLKRFPEYFMFQLTLDEKEQVILQLPHLRNLKFSPSLPFAFTEYGAVMLASVLKSDKAICVNIQIVRIFTRIRNLLSDNTELRLEVERIKKKIEHNKSNIELIFQYLDNLFDKKTSIKPRKKLASAFQKRENKEVLPR